MKNRSQKWAKTHLKWEPKELQNEIKIGSENGVGKVLRREGFWAKMVPKMDPNLVQKHEKSGSKIGPKNMKNEGAVCPTAVATPVIYLKVDNLKITWRIIEDKVLIE